MRNTVLSLYVAITATLGVDTKEYVVAQAIVRHTAEMRRFHASLDRLVAGRELSENLAIKNWTLGGHAKISARLRKKLKLS